jgi:uncharacterized protein with NRDE domain
MCTLILRFGDDGLLIGANRDEMLARPWDLPGEFWTELPGVVAGRDRLAGGTWLGVNAHGVVAAVLNREGKFQESTLGPAAGKRSRGELPLLALTETTAQAAAEKIASLDAAAYRSFNLVTADRAGAFWVAGLEQGRLETCALERRTWMITSGQPNQMSLPRIARHLPKFIAAPAAEWPALLADDAPPAASALNILPHDGFGTVCSSVISLRKTGEVDWQFAAGPPHEVGFKPVKLA